MLQKLAAVLAYFIAAANHITSNTSFMQKQKLLAYAPPIFLHSILWRRCKFLHHSFYFILDVRTA